MKSTVQADLRIEVQCPQIIQPTRVGTLPSHRSDRRDVLRHEAEDDDTPERRSDGKHGTETWYDGERLLRSAELLD